MGINIPELSNLILASPSKSQIRVLQSIGRTLRKSNDPNDIATIYDLVDDLSWKTSRNHTLKHGMDRAKIYMKEKLKIKTFGINL